VPTPFATENDVQALLTMLFMSSLTGGQPPLFMDFRKVWEPWEIKALADRIGFKLPVGEAWAEKGFVDGDNSGSASLDWAAKPGASVDEIMAKVSMPLADPGYFPGMGNSVTYVSPGGLEGIAGRLTYSDLSGLFSMSWDEASTAEITDPLATAFCQTTTADWPHSFIVPKYATMGEYKHLPPANHFHMVQGLSSARLEYWMDLNCVLSQANWAARPAYIEGVDRPLPLIYAANGGENAAKMMLGKKL
jgi:L-fucose isomerase